MAHNAGSYPRVRRLTAAESGDRDRLEAERLNMYLTALRPPSPPAASVGAYQSAARSSARYKAAFVPRCFFNSSLNPPSSLLPFSCAGVVPQAAASSIPPTTSPFPTEGYGATSPKNASSQLPALIRPSPRQYCLVDHYDDGSALDNDADEVPGFPGPRRPVRATALDA
jgi:hypothetical protein